MARAWFFLVLLNSSSFSATRLSISCLTLASSSWERRTLFSSMSRVASASSRAPWSSSFSCSSIRRCLSRAWMERPPSPSWSRRSLISSARFLFSRLTTSSCSMDSCWAAFRRNSSEEKLRPSSWEALISAWRSAALDCHSPRTLSKFLARFSVIRSKSTLGLLSSSNLGGENINKFLILNNLSLKLVASSLKLFNAAHTLSLIARFPELGLSLSLGQGLQGIRLAHGLILKLLSQVLEVSGQHLELGKEGSTVLGLSISKSLGVLQLGGDGDLGLVHVGDGILKLLNLSVEVLVLNLETLLGRLSLIECSGHLVQSGVGVNNGGLEQPALLVKLSLALDSILKIKTSITEVKLKSRLVLLRLDLVGIEAVNLLTEVRHGVVVLHAESSKSSLLSNVQ